MFKLFKTDELGSSRLQIDIKGLDKNTLILSDHKHRAVLKVSSINFELRSEAEQDIIIENYQVFLNSLPCPIQVLFRVREMDIEDYIANFKQNQLKEKKTIYRKQINEYTRFVKEMVSDNRILSRNFYIVIPYDSAQEEAIDSIQENLNLNCEIISDGLSKIGIKTSRLSSLDILDLFYSFYSPDKSKTESITDKTLKLVKEAYF
jgi:hypothetical protein